jgi:phenylacetate-CoA ligase
MSKKIYNHLLSFEGDKAIMGMSREIEGLIQLGQDLDSSYRESFRLAIYGSGVMQPRVFTELKRVYPNLDILSYFASNQAEAIGMQLRPDTYLTAFPGLHLIEIVDDNGQWVKEGEEGELVITRLHALEVPILRMNLGDRMIRRPDYISDDLHAMQMEFGGRSGDIIHLGESHYAAARVYDAICRRFKETDIIDLESRVEEVQFLNDRKQKILHLRVSMDDVSHLAPRVYERLEKMGKRELFIEALKESLSLFDQTDAQYRALEKTHYRFEIKLVERGSKEFYRTVVNKTPLIKDIL